MPGLPSLGKWIKQLARLLPLYVYLSLSTSERNRFSSEVTRASLICLYRRKALGYIVVEVGTYATAPTAAAVAGLIEVQVAMA